MKLCRCTDGTSVIVGPHTSAVDTRIRLSSSSSGPRGPTRESLVSTTRSLAASCGQVRSAQAHDPKSYAVLGLLATATPGGTGAGRSLAHGSLAATRSTPSPAAA